MAQPIINYWAVLVAGIIYMGIGALWYSPLLFGKLWQNLSGISDKQIDESKKKGMWKSYLINFIGSLLAAFALAVIIDYAEAATIASGAMIGILVWFGFIATATLGTVLWEGKPWMLYALNNSYHLISLIIIGAMIAIWT